MATPFHEVVAALKTNHIRYLVGGSFASTYHGVPRATNDADLLVQLKASSLDSLARSFGKDFYFDVQHAADCIVAGRPFNVLHKLTAYKFDFFPALSTFHDSELLRAIEATFDFMDESITCKIATREDIVLAKLDWYRRGGCNSERQWADITNVLAAASEQLDRAYLDRWAKALDVSDLVTLAIG